MILQGTIEKKKHTGEQQNWPLCLTFERAHRHESKYSAENRKEAPMEGNKATDGEAEILKNNKKKKKA